MKMPIASLGKGEKNNLISSVLKRKAFKLSIEDGAWASTWRESLTDLEKATEEERRQQGSAVAS